jgi:DNA-binding NtrC family response regulator
MTKILLVDDDAAFLNSTQRYLQTAGYEVLEARNGNEAIGLLRAQRVDLVITDILMPEKDGLEIIPEIRLRWPELKIIAVSGGGYCDAGMYVDLSLKLGATQALEKPFAQEKLLAVLRKCLDESQPETQSHAPGRTPHLSKTG